MDLGLLFPLLVTVCSGAALLICAREFLFESMERIDSRRRMSLQMFDQLRDRWLDDSENREITVSDSAFEKIIEARAYQLRQAGQSVENSSSYLMFMGALGLLSAIGFVTGIMAF